MVKRLDKETWRKVAAVLGHYGGTKASARMTPAQRKARARKAAKARWGKRKKRGR